MNTRARQGSRSPVPVPGPGRIPGCMFRRSGVDAVVGGFGSTRALHRVDLVRLRAFSWFCSASSDPGFFLTCAFSVSPIVAGGAGSASRTKGKPTVLPFARRLHVYMTTMTCGVLYTTARLNVGVRKEIEHHWLYPAGHENRLRVRNLL